jgi:CDP-glycerol glycerophosphotransferase
MVTLLLLLSPKRPHVVVFGYPESEGNAIEMVRALTGRYRGHIYLLAGNIGRAERVIEAAGLAGQPNLTIVPHHSLAGLWRFATAEVAMFTHGLYGYPRRVPRKVLVNLWHGSGIKAGTMVDHRGRPRFRADFLVSASRKKGQLQAKHSRLPANGLLLTGNPRIDQFDGFERDRVRELGIDPDRPFVLWMPTFRRSRLHPEEWDNTAPKNAPGKVNDIARSVVMELAKAGVQTVVKPHPSDVENRDVGGITVTNEMLIDSGIFLYQLMGVSDGLITDYSSVWVDYLALDRPIGFLVPDEDTYCDERGFDPPDALDWLPGPRIVTTEDIKSFADDVRAGGVRSAARRTEVIQHLEIITARPVADRILNILAARGVFGSRIALSEFDACEPGSNW